MWGRMAAAAVTCGTPGGKSQGPCPPLRPRARGRHSTGPDAARRAGDHRPPPGAPLPLPSSSPAPGGAAPRRAPPRTCARGLPWGPPNPHCPSAPRARGLCPAVSPGHPSLPADRRQDPPSAEPLWGPPPRRGGRPRPAPHPSRRPGPDCAPAPWAESLPSPRSRARRASSPSSSSDTWRSRADRLLQLHLSPREGGARAGAECRWCGVRWGPGSRGVCGGWERGGLGVERAVLRVGSWVLGEYPRLS